MVHVFERLGLSVVYSENISGTKRSGIQDHLSGVNRAGRRAVDGASGTCAFVVADWRSVGDPFCGAPTRAGASYCPRHQRLCTVSSGSAEGRVRAAAIIEEAEAVPEPPPELAHLKETAVPEPVLDDAGDLRALLDNPPPDPAERDRSET